MRRNVTQYEICSDVSPIFAAVRNNDVNLVQNSLSYAGVYDSMKMTALMHAARHNYLDIVKVLEPLEGHLTGSLEETALMHAAECGALEVTEYLLSLHKHIKSDDLLESYLESTMLAGEIQCAELLYRKGKYELGITPLMWAAFVGDVSSIQQKIVLKNELCKRSRGGYTALMFAACSNQTQAIRLLLPYEAGLRDNYEQTSLMHAAQNSSVDAARLLIEKELGLSTKIGSTALYLAAKQGCVEIVDMTMKKEHPIFFNGFSALYIAANNGHLECVKRLIQYLDVFKKSDDTGLSGAASGGHIKVVEFLIPYEATIINSEDGTTALMHAVQNNQIECARILKKYELGIVTKSGMTALSMAAMNGSSELVSLLSDELPLITGDIISPLETCLSSGHTSPVSLLLPYEKDRVGATDLMLHACLGNRDLVRRLKGTMLLQQDSDGRTALMYAVIGGQLDCAKDLLVESRITDNKGCSALMYTVLLGPNECLPFLKLLTGLTGIQDENGETALMKAASTNNYAAVQYLAQYEKRIINDDGDTALLIAARVDAYKSVEYLLDEIDITDQFGSSVFENAKNYGGYNVYQMLIANTKNSF